LELLPNFVGEEIRKGASFQQKKKPRRPHSRAPKRKDAPVPENKVVSLDERAKDEEKPFLEQLLQGLEPNPTNPNSTSKPTRN
jgi:hypothetical protein